MRTGSQRGFTRRLILQAGLGGAIASGAAAPGKSRVVIARDPGLRGAGRSPDANRVLQLLDRAMQSFYDCDAPLDAWKQVVRPGEVVGLKVNCLSGRGASTSTVLVEAICERLQQAGIPAQNIVIWDRLNSDLESAGFPVSSRKDRIRCIGNDAAGYDSELAVYGSAGSLLSNTLTRDLRRRHQPAGAQGPRHRGRDAGAQEPVRRHSQSQQVPHQCRRSLRGGRQYVPGHPAESAAVDLRRASRRSTKAGLPTCRNGRGRTTA